MSIRGRILIVDDDQGILESARLLFEERDIEVEVSSGDPLLLEKIEEIEDCDLVFCDIALPMLSGWDVAKAVREQMQQAKIYIMTGWDAEACNDPRRKHVDGVILKPFDVEALESLAEKHIVSRPKSRMRTKKLRLSNARDFAQNHCDRKSVFEAATATKAPPVISSEGLKKLATITEEKLQASVGKAKPLSSKQALALASSRA